MIISSNMHIVIFRNEYLRKINKVSWKHSLPTSTESYHSGSSTFKSLYVTRPAKTTSEKNNNFEKVRVAILIPRPWFYCIFFSKYLNLVFLWWHTIFISYKFTFYSKNRIRFKPNSVQTDNVWIVFACLVLGIKRLLTSIQLLY
jgi:hypothetical protein